MAKNPLSSDCDLKKTDKDSKNANLLYHMLDEGMPHLTEKELVNMGMHQNQACRMVRHKNVKKYIIYPENKNKHIWDVFMTFILMLTCIITPLNIAFQGEVENIESIVIEHMINALFFVDIIVIFISAFYDEDVDLIDDRKIIAVRYL